MKLALLPVLAFVLVACPPPEKPLDPSDPTATCASACSNVRGLRCDGFVTPRGSTCDAACQNAHTEGAVDWPVGCLSKAPTCGAVKLCR